ncbi:MAG: hypothetical protein JNL81_09750 [Hyphomonadaceae bacterium]|nr:hypothetical protein [Hyphomonadaceae bacterium]
MTEEQFDMLLTGILERPIEKMSDEEVVHRMSVTQAAVDRLLNELERRGLLTFASDGAPIIPFDVPDSRYVETILTRD